MDKPWILFRRSITWRLAGMVLLIVFLFFVGAGAMNYVEHKELGRFQRQADELAGKQKLVSEIAQHLNGIFFHSRGFFATSSEQEYERILADKDGFEKALAEYERLGLEPDEQAWIRTLRNFFDPYFDKTLPDALEQSRNAGPDGVRRMFGAELDRGANDLIAGALQRQQNNQTELERAQQRLDERLSGQGPRFLLYGIALLALAILLLYRTARDISMPIGKLSARAKKFSMGIVEEVEYTARQDEIGGLARSLETMMQELRSKGEELLAQNEELLAQQDELQMQQEELSGALLKMEASERNLLKRNLLVQSLGITLDRRKLLRDIIHNMVDLLQADKGIVLLGGTAKDGGDGGKDHASLGLSDEAVGRFLAACEEGLLVRVREEKKPYALNRNATPGEAGYHEEGVTASDLYVPVVDSRGGLAACLVLTRIGRAFAPAEEEEAAAFAIQISLSLEKLRMYESAEDERRLTQNMLDTIQEGIQLLDRDGTTIQVNSKWYELMGLEAGTDVCLKLGDFYARLKPLVKDMEPVSAFIDELVRTPSDEERSLVYETAPPERRYIQMYSEPLYRGAERLGSLLVHRDITREYEADQLKSEFVSTVSHELRTPLASVLGFAELLLHKQLTPERQRKYIQTIHQEANRLTALINDFLDLQRMESGKQSYEFRPVRVAELIGEVLELYPESAPGHSFVFRDESEGARVKADADKIRQVLMNLLGNAVKYSPSGGAVTVACRREGDRLVVDVADEGLGIPEEAIPRLFGKFYRVDNSDRRQIGGTGLGLAIVKEIMAIHGGDVGVSSEYGRGSTFRLSFPLAETGRPPEPADAGGGKKPTVYIVEDDASLSELLTDELVGSGYAVKSFIRGEDAIAAMEKSPPDALVLDLILGNGIGGLELLERLQRDERLRSVPILVSSAFEEQERAHALGAAGYLVKPYQPTRLSEALIEVLKTG